MTSWAVVADVYYLPAMKQYNNETSIEFANRVKEKICQKSGLKNVKWDGYLKHFTPSSRYVKQRQQKFANKLLNRLAKNKNKNINPKKKNDITQNTLRKR